MGSERRSEGRAGLLSSSGDRIEALRERVEVQQEELQSAVAELETAARSVVDPRNWIRRRPLLWVTGSVLIGAWLGSRRSGEPWRHRS
jgi:hypothetical protein